MEGENANPLGFGGCRRAGGKGARGDRRES